jgi:predicted DNA-binding transcriptional regulator AlpA
MTNDQSDSYLTGPMVNKRFNISAMTRWRWERDPRLSFPPPLKINNRSYWQLAALQLWESNRPSKSVAASGAAPPARQEVL